MPHGYHSHAAASVPKRVHCAAPSERRSSFEVGARWAFGNYYRSNASMCDIGSPGTPVDLAVKVRTCPSFDTRTVEVWTVFPFFLNTTPLVSRSNRFNAIVSQSDPAMILAIIVRLSVADAGPMGRPLQLLRHATVVGHLCSAYKSQPSGRLGLEAINLFFCN